VAAGLAKRGHHVTILTASYPGARPEERTGSVSIRRRGGKLMVYPAASLALAFRRVRDVDVVVDVQNGIPFFSRLATNAPVVVLVHHVHREQWPVVYGRVAASVGWWMESRLAPLVYRSATYVAVSEHTRQELVELGVGADRIVVVHNGTDQVVASYERADTPRLVCLGRLVPHKQIEHALRLIDRLRWTVPGVHLDIVGDGWWRQNLLLACRSLGLENDVTFHGHVSERDKNALLGRAWVSVLPSMKEGWGLSVMEAAAHAVPTVGYRASGGLADNVLHGHTGLLVDDEPGLHEATLRLLNDDGLRERLGEQAQRRAETFRWEDTTSGFEKVLLDVTAARGPRRCQRRDAVR
jgi:glycosyltransferase involved in cell wall biosynthesis